MVIHVTSRDVQDRPGLAGSELTVANGQAVPSRPNPSQVVPGDRFANLSPNLSQVGYTPIGVPDAGTGWAGAGGGRLPAAEVVPGIGGKSVEKSTVGVEKSTPWGPPSVPTGPAAIAGGVSGPRKAGPGAQAPRGGPIALGPGPCYSRRTVGLPGASWTFSGPRRPGPSRRPAGSSRRRRPRARGRLSPTVTSDGLAWNRSERPKA